MILPNGMIEHVDDLLQLLQRLQNPMDRVGRHLWLHDALHWLRATGSSPADAAGRLGLMVDAVRARPALVEAWRAWWQAFVADTDATPLLADLGFAPRTAFVSELGQRLRLRWLPASPDTRDLQTLFEFLRPGHFDAQWLQALDAHTLEGLEALLGLSDPGENLPAQATVTLLDALTYCVGQVSATGYAAEIRTRMADPRRDTQAFHALQPALAALRQALESGADAAALDAAAQTLREQLDACRQAANTVYTHLQTHGISVGIVFRLRQLRLRVIRCRHLLDTLQARAPLRGWLQLLAHLAHESEDNRSLRQLLLANSHMLAEKVAERSAESGEHYITRNRAEYRDMLRRAAGGGAVIGLTTWAKFGIYTLALSPFWSGLAAGLNYALSFVLIMLLHWTVATKQPAVTAPAMAARLKQLQNAGGVDSFVDEVAHLYRSQVAAIAGNLGAVVPMVLLICATLWATGGQAMVTPEQARHVLHEMHLLGPTALFAAFTGVLLFASSIVAGWVENAFVLHQLDSAIAHHPRWRRWLGPARSQAIGRWLLRNISGLAANLSLGLMLGLVPVMAQFFGLGLEVRHVTLSAGQISAAAFTLGPQVLSSADFWWALGGLLLVGPLNLGVSFYLAFRVALAAQNVSGQYRGRIRQALYARIRQAPMSFVRPPADPPDTAGPAGVEAESMPVEPVLDETPAESTLPDSPDPSPGAFGEPGASSARSCKPSGPSSDLA